MAIGRWPISRSKHAGAGATDGAAAIMLHAMFTPGSVEELAAFATLQQRTPDLFRALSADAATPQRTEPVRLK